MNDPEPLPYVSIDVASARLTERVDLRLASGADISPYGGWFGAGPLLGLGLPGSSMFLDASFMPGLWIDFDHHYRLGPLHKVWVTRLNSAVRSVLAGRSIRYQPSL